MDIRTDTIPNPLTISPRRVWVAMLLAGFCNFFVGEAVNQFKEGAGPKNGITTYRPVPVR